MSREYVFIDEWDEQAPIDSVFNALADSRTYPEWWDPVYISVEADGDPREGLVRDRLKGGRGSDRMRARDGKRDRVRCGRGEDFVRADRRDKVSGGCEHVRRRRR